MPLSTKTKVSLITEELKNQIESNGKLDDNFPVFIGNSLTKEEPKKYTDVANLHFSKGMKALFKSFFSAQGVTLVQGVETSVAYVIKEVSEGRLKISRNGIDKLKQ